MWPKRGERRIIIIQIYCRSQRYRIPRRRRWPRHRRGNIARNNYSGHSTPIISYLLADITMDDSPTRRRNYSARYFLNEISRQVSSAQRWNAAVRPKWIHIWESITLVCPPCLTETTFSRRGTTGRAFPILRESTVSLSLSSTNLTEKLETEVVLRGIFRLWH